MRRAGIRLRALTAAAALAALAAGIAAGAGDDDDAAARVLASDLPLDPARVPRFEDVTREAGIALPHQPAGCNANVAGAAWADVEGDGDPDLYLPQGLGPSRLWIDQGGGRYVERARAAGVADVPLATGASFADYDNDGDPDLYVTSRGENRLYENAGDGGFLDVTRIAGVGDRGAGTSAAWGDYDGDGRLDLYVANGDNCTAPRAAPDRLYRNAGDGRFEDVTSLLRRGGATTEGVGLQVAWIDYDADGDQDLYLANDHLDFRGNELWRNDGPGQEGWRFTPVGQAAGADLEVSSMGIGVGDLSGDGRPDLVVSDEGPPWVLAAAGGDFRRARLPGPASRREPITWGVAVEDFDNDGHEDVLAAAGPMGARRAPQRDRLYLADGRGGFREVGRRAGVADAGWGRAVATADVNGDGLLDAAIARLGQPPLLLVNRGAPAGRRNGWLELRLRGTRSPADACGARVRVRVGGRTLMRWLACGSEGFASSSQRLVHFGLGRASRYEAIEIAWPSGTVQRLEAGRANRRLTVTEPRR